MQVDSRVEHVELIDQPLGLQARYGSVGGRADRHRSRQPAPAPLKVSPGRRPRRSTFAANQAQRFGCAARRLLSRGDSGHPSARPSFPQGAAASDHASTATASARGGLAWGRRHRQQLLEALDSGSQAGRRQAQARNTLVHLPTGGTGCLRWRYPTIAVTAGAALPPPDRRRLILQRDHRPIAVGEPSLRDTFTPGQWTVLRCGSAP